MAGGTSLGCFIGWRRCSREVPAVALAAACAALAAAVAAAALAAALAALGTALAAAALVVALAAAALVVADAAAALVVADAAATIIVADAAAAAWRRRLLSRCCRTAVSAPLSQLGGLSQELRTGVMKW